MCNSPHREPTIITAGSGVRAPQSERAQTRRMRNIKRRHVPGTECSRSDLSTNDAISSIMQEPLRHVECGYMWIVEL